MNYIIRIHLETEEKFIKSDSEFKLKKINKDCV